MARPFEDLINQVADQEGVPHDVAQALVDTENPRRDPALAIQESYGHGSFGLTMITYTTARSLGFGGSPGQLLEPRTNLTYGLRYLRQMFDGPGKGDWITARAAYNAGPDLRPWPAADIARFKANLAKWSGGRPMTPPTLQAGFGGLLPILVLVGVALPLLVRFLRGRAHA